MDEQSSMVTPASMPGAVTDDGIDDALAGLDGLEERAVNEHVAVFEAVHATLQRALAESEG